MEVGWKKGVQARILGQGELPLICGYIYRSVAYRKGLQGPLMQASIFQFVLESLHASRKYWE